VLVPTLGGPWLASCLAAVVALDPPADRVVVVHSGAAALPAVPPGVELLRLEGRAGFAAAVNAGIAAVEGDVSELALLNDDATPEPQWLGVLGAVLADDRGVAAVQGTVTDARGERVDGRGLTLDRWGLPVQVDRGQPLEPVGEAGLRARAASRLGVSATAALLRVAALDEVRLGQGLVLDESLGSYHEDLDLALRLRRCGWRAAWAAGVRCRHLGSATARRLCWRHPWWLLANRWHVLAANSTLPAMVRALPRLARGELRAVRTLARANPRALVVAPAVLLALPLLVARGRARRSAGPRLDHLPEAGA
jgi:GT2 family glycosyltransferase